MRTRVGYAGGTTTRPTYRNIGDHAETIQIDYDPTRISYADLLTVYWSAHTPTRPAPSSQYEAVIFYHDEEQRRLAETSHDRLAGVMRDEILTQIRPFKGFTAAEDYHQKYRLRHEPKLYEEFGEMYPNDADFVASTAAARVNGYLDGCGSRSQLEVEIDSLGLTRAGRKHLLALVPAAPRRG